MLKLRYMSPDEKSAQYLDLNANERLLEIQAEIVKIEKKRLVGKMSEKEKEESGEKIKFLVMEEKLILEARYAKQKGVKETEYTNMDNENVNQNPISENEERKKETKELKDILEKEIANDEKIEVELKEIIQATKERKWYETWWGKIVIIIVGTLLLSLLTSEPINFSNIIS